MWVSPLQAVQVTVKGSGTVLTASAQHPSQAATARQQAALDLIHQLQQAVLAMLTASAPDRVIATAAQSSAGNSASPVMKILHEGDLENSMPEVGNVVKVQYQLIHDCQEGVTQEVNNASQDNDGESPSLSKHPTDRMDAIWLPNLASDHIYMIRLNLIAYGNAVEAIKTWQYVCLPGYWRRCFFVLCHLLLLDGRCTHSVYSVLIYT